MRTVKRRIRLGVYGNERLIPSLQRGVASSSFRHGVPSCLYHIWTDKTFCILPKLGWRHTAAGRTTSVHERLVEDLQGPISSNKGRRNHGPDASERSQTYPMPTDRCSSERDGHQGRKPRSGSGRVTATGRFWELLKTPLLATRLIALLRGPHRKISYSP